VQACVPKRNAGHFLLLSVAVAAMVWPGRVDTAPCSSHCSMSAPFPKPSTVRSCRRRIGSPSSSGSPGDGGPERASPRQQRRKEREQREAFREQYYAKACGVGVGSV